MELTQELVRKLFSYDTETGDMIWNPNPEKSKAWNTRFAYKVAGSVNKTRKYEYKQVQISGKQYRMARLVFLYHHGYLPDLVEHKDTNSLNNLIDNLREATKSQNSANTGLRSDNTSGVKNVSLTSNGKYQVLIRIPGTKKRFCATFSTLEEAAEVAKAKREELYGEFARGN